MDLTLRPRMRCVAGKTVLNRRSSKRGDCRDLTLAPVTACRTCSQSWEKLLDRCSSPGSTPLRLHLLTFFSSMLGHSPTNQSAQNLNWSVCVAHNSGNMHWKVHFYISSPFWYVHHNATFSKHMWSYTCQYVSPILGVNTWPMIQGICPEKFTFISVVVFEICVEMLIFHGISGHTPANMSAQNLYWVCLPGP